MNHDEAWDRIPWLINGRADAAEREHLEAHLRVCEECRIEVAVQRQVMTAIASDKRIDVVPGTAFQRLWDRIAADALHDESEPEAVEPVAAKAATETPPSRRHSVSHSFDYALAGCCGDRRSDRAHGADGGLGFSLGR